MGADLLLRGDQFHELAHLPAQVAPAALDMLNQRLRLVLRQNGDLTDSGVHAIRQHKVDDAELAAERRRGLAAVLGEASEALAAAPGHDYRQCTAGQSADIPSSAGPG